MSPPPPFTTIFRRRATSSSPAPAMSSPARRRSGRRSLPAPPISKVACTPSRLRWSVHEAVLVRELAERLERMAESRRRLIAMALAPACGRKPPETLMAWCEILLDFPAWQRLARDHDGAADAVAQRLARALIALAREALRDPEQGCSAIEARQCDKGG